MPLFEYQCEKCGHRFEELQARAATQAPLCPKCGASQTARQLSTFSAASHEGGGSGADSCPTGTCPFN